MSPEEANANVVRFNELIDLLVDNRHSLTTAELEFLVVKFGAAADKIDKILARKNCDVCKGNDIDRMESFSLCKPCDDEMRAAWNARQASNFGQGREE
jgi:hypothetical protein